MTEDFLDEQVRAEDIILGSCGFGEDAELLSVSLRGARMTVLGRWRDNGEQFTYEGDDDDELDDLQRWAIDVLKKFGRAF